MNVPSCVAGIDAGVGLAIRDAVMDWARVARSACGLGLLAGCGMAMALATGAPDPGFGSGNGYVPVFTADSARLHAVVRSANRIVAGGSIGSQGLLLQRFDSGQIDPTFWNAGIKALDELAEVTAIAVLPNFDLVAAGWRDAGMGQRQAVLARYNSSGFLVASFGSAGVAALPSGANSQFNALVFANDRLTAVGSVDGSFLAARFHQDGSLDTGFALVGYRADVDGAIGGELKSLQVAADGSTIAVGLAASFTGIAMRYEADGDADTGFAGDGILSFTTGTALTDAGAVQAGPGGSWWVGGTSYNAAEAMGDQFIARLTSGGALDIGFAAGQGFVNLTSSDHLDDRGFALALAPDGKPTIAGTSQNADGRYVAAIARVNATSGVLDAGFGDGGRIEILGMAQADPDNDLRALSIGADGSLLAAGALAPSPGQYYPHLIQRVANGLPDVDFHAEAGHAFVAPDAGIQSGRSVRVRATPDGGVVVAGFVYAQPQIELELARFDGNGRVDATFAGGNGYLRRGYPGGGLPLLPRDLLVRGDGRIVVVADAETGGVDGDVVLYQFLANGNPDNGFGVNGRVVLAVSGNNDLALSLALQPDGRLLVYGRSLAGGDWSYWLARLESNGALDASFFAAAAVPGLGILETVSPGRGGAMVLLGSGRILVADGAGNLKRRLADGSSDSSFGSGGSVPLPNAASFQPWAIAIDSLGRIVLGGALPNAGNVDDCLVRLLASGNADLAFGTAGVVVRDEDSTDGINAVLVQRNGRILTAGKNYIANLSRYAPDGSPDSRFAPAGRIAFEGRGVQGLALDAQGRILATRRVLGSGGEHLGVVRIGGDLPLTVQLAGGGAGTVLSQPDFIHCGGTCSSDFASGENVTLQAQAAPGSVFIGWSGTFACGSGDTCAFPMPESALTVTAIFRSDALFKDSFD